MSARPLHLLLALGLLGFFLVFFFWPILSILSGGFTDSLGNFTLEYLNLVLSDAVVLRGLLNSLIIALSVTLASVLIAVPLALLSARTEFPGRALLSGLVLLPLILPPFVGAMGLRLVLSRYGPLTTMLGQSAGLGIDWLGELRGAGVVFVEAFALFPIVFLNLRAALANVDPALERAAANLGSSRWRIWTRITFPLIRPGVFAGSTLVLIWSFTELGTPLMFNLYEVTPVQIFYQISEPDNPASAALVTVMLACSALLYALGKLSLGRGMVASSVRSSGSAEPIPLRGWRAAFAIAAFALVLIPATLPHLSVVTTSLSPVGAWHRSILPESLTLTHYVEALEDDLVAPRIGPNGIEFGALGNSVLYASAATVLTLVLAAAAGVVIVRSRVPGRGAIDLLSMTPLAVPGLVMAFGYLSVSSDLRNQLGDDLPRWLDVQRWPVALLVFAYAARRLPYAVRSVVAGLEQTPVELEHAAANLGARFFRIVRSITFPLIAANLIAGAILAFTFALLEVSDSLILAQTSRFYPITKAIWELSLRLGDGLYLASALGTWAMLVLALAITATNKVLGKRIGALFRA